MSRIDSMVDSRRQMLAAADCHRCSPRRCCGCLTSILTSSVCVGVLFVAYVFAGAFMFKEIELRNEVTSLSAEEMMTSDIRPAIDEIWRSLNLKTEDFYFNETTTSASGCQLAAILRRLQMQAVLRSLNAMSPWDLPTQRWTNEKTTTSGTVEMTFGNRRWSLPGAVLFTVSTLTTVGYSGATPRTILGRLLTIPYAAFGIPLTFYFLSRVGRDLAVILRVFYRRVCCDFICCKLCQRRQRQKLYEMTSSLNGDIVQSNYVDRTLTYRSSVEADPTSNRSAHVYESIGSRASARRHVSKSQVLSTAEIVDDLIASGGQRSPLRDPKSRLVPVRSDPLMNRLAVTPAPTTVDYATRSLPNSKRRSPRLNKMVLDRALLNSVAGGAVDTPNKSATRRRRHSDVRRTTSDGLMAATSTTGVEGKRGQLASTTSAVNETTSLDRRKTKVRSSSSSAAVGGDPLADAAASATNKSTAKGLSVKPAVGSSSTTKLDKTTPNDVALSSLNGCRNSKASAAAADTSQSKQLNTGAVGLTSSSRRLAAVSGRRPSSVAIAAVRHGRRAPSPGKRKDKSASAGGRVSGRNRKSDRHAARSTAAADHRASSARDGRTVTGVRGGNRNSGGCFADLVRIGSMVSSQHYDSDESFVTASNSTPTTSRKLLGNSVSRDSRYSTRVGREERLIGGDIDDEVVIETSEVFIDGPNDPDDDGQQQQKSRDGLVSGHLSSNNLADDAAETTGTLIYSPRSVSTTYGLRRVPSSSSAAVPLPLCIAVLFGYLIGGAALFVHVRQAHDCFSESRLLADAVDEDWLTAAFVSFAALTTVGGWYPTPCNSSFAYGNNDVNDDFRWPPDERYIYAAWLVGGLSLVAMAVIIVLDCILQGTGSCPLNTCCCCSRTKPRPITPVDV